MLDGAMHNNPYDNLNLPLPFPDALQEFRAETSALTAQNGMHSGGAVNAVTKSGTNSFRGDVFEFFRHHSFNATDPFATKKPDGSRKDDGLKRNQYGVTIGGPIKTDRLFFFCGYQGTNTTREPDRQPRVRADGGDAGGRLHGVRLAGLQRRRAAQPAARRSSATGSIPRCSARRRSTSPPGCRRPTDPCGLVQYGLPSATDEWQYVAKVDYTMSDKHSLFGRYIATTQFTPPPFSLEVGAAEPAGHAHRRPRQPGADVHARRELRDQLRRTLNAVRFAYNRTDIHRTSTDFFSAPEVGINIYSYMPHYMLLNVTGGLHSSAAARRRQSTFDTPSWQISDDLTLVRGGHQFVFGGSFARWKSLIAWPTSVRPASSPSTARSHRARAGRLPAGQDGNERRSSRRRRTRSTWSRNTSGCTRRTRGESGPRLTLNYGLRWEPFFPQQLVNGAVYQFDMARFQRGHQEHGVSRTGRRACISRATRASPARRACRPTGTTSVRASALAWDPAGDGRTSVRASYGKSYEFVNAQFHLNTSVAPPWGSEVRLNAPPGGLDNPFLGSPGGQTNIFPVTFDQNAPFSLNGPFLSLTNDLDVDQRPLVQRDRRAAAQRAVVCDGRLRRQPDEQHLGVHAAQQRAVHPGPRHRRRAEHRQHQQSPSAQR